MANPPKKKGLGKGLGALIGGSPAASSLEPAPPSSPAQAAPAAPEFPAALPDGTRLVLVRPEEVEKNPKQPRRVFNEDALEELCESIRRDGVQEPIIVRERNGRYELVSGERRVRASIMADLAEIPAVVRDVPDEDLLKIGLIENLQREDLNVMEVAHAYQQLMEEFAWTQEQLADEVGKKRTTVTNTLRLLNLPPPVQDLLGSGSLSMGHARALLALEDPAAQHSLARRAIDQGLSVRDLEKIVANAKKGPQPSSPPPRKDPNVESIETTLRRSLGTKVTLRHSGNRGKIEIEYYDNDDLDRLLQLLQR